MRVYVQSNMHSYYIQTRLATIQNCTMRGSIYSVYKHYFNNNIPYVMKKITFLMSLLLSLIGVSATAQTINVSGEPSDGDFVENTHWYLIKAASTGYYHKAGYLSNATDYVSETAGFRLDNTTVPTSDDGLWCLVGNETDGYTIYNKGAGAGKVFGYKDIAKLYETGSEDGATTKFDLVSSTNSNYPLASCIKLHGATTEYNLLNNANWNDGTSSTACKVGAWKDTGDAGNAFYFIPVDNSTIASTAATAYLTFLTFNSIAPSIKNICATELSAFENAPTSDNAQALTKAINNAVGSKGFRLQNYRSTDNVLYAKGGYALIKNESELNKDAAAVWTFKANENGTVKLYNLNTKTYMGSLSTSYKQTDPSTEMVSDESSALNFNVSIYKYDYNGANNYYWIITDETSHKLNGEDTNNGGRVNNWSGTGSGNSNVWKITEATSLEVALNSVKGLENTYASAYLPFSISSVSGATAYLGALDTDNNVLRMTETTTGVPAEKGFILVGESGASTATLTLGESSNTDNNNSLTGTLEAITLGSDATPRANYLTFGVNSNTVGFYVPSESVSTIPANKAFINATLLSGSKAIAMEFHTTPTGISNAVATPANASAPVFDLSGRRVANPAKGGIYIQNGKKFVK